MVYFVTKDNKIKIGYTTNIDKRLKELNNQYGKIDLIAIIKGTRKLEKAFHTKFEKYSIGNEWFKLNHEILNFIQTLEKTKDKTDILFPKITIALKRMGENIKLARLRRKIKTEQLAERAGISRATLWMIENGSARVAMGYYAKVLHSLNMLNSIENLAADDILGRKLQDAELLGYIKR